MENRRNGLEMGAKNETTVYLSCKGHRKGRSSKEQNAGSFGLVAWWEMWMGRSWPTAYDGKRRRRLVWKQSMVASK